jgi:hypothetical protein
MLSLLVINIFLFSLGGVLYLYDIRDNKLLNTKSGVSRFNASFFIYEDTLVIVGFSSINTLSLPTFEAISESGSEQILCSTLE